MVKKVWSGLILFWGIVLIVILINALRTTSFASLSTSNEMIRFPLQERFGIVLSNVESCTHQGKMHTFKEALDIKTTCTNGKCNTDIIFPNSLIPTEVGLYVKQGTECILKEFPINNENLQTLGYQVNVYLSEKEKKRLGIINNTDNFRLKQAHKYSRCGTQTIFYYDTNLTEDTLLVNEEPKSKIFFDMGQHLNLVQNEYGMIQDSTYSSNSKLFSYMCYGYTQCIRKANTNIILADGVYVEIKADFVEQCLKNEMEHNNTNPYCKDIIYKGELHRIDATQEKISQLLSKGENSMERKLLDQYTEKINQKIYRDCQANK